MARLCIAQIVAMKSSIWQLAGTALAVVGNVILLSQFRKDTGLALTARPCLTLALMAICSHAQLVRTTRKSWRSSIGRTRGRI